MSLSILAFGLLLGMRHAADPDHVVAVSTLVMRHKKLGAAWLLGAFWGLGHSITIFLVGTALILCKVNISPGVERGLEFPVGLALVALGLLNIAGYGLGSVGLKPHSHAHTHDDPEHQHLLLDHGSEVSAHAHFHVHEIKPNWLKGLMRDTGSWQILRAFTVGLIHGLAGSAAVALLVLAAIPDARTAVFYLIIFGLGTMGGMLALSGLMGLSMYYLIRWWKPAEWAITLATGLLSVLFGLHIAYHSGLALMAELPGMAKNHKIKTIQSKETTMIFFTKAPEITVEDLKTKLDRKEKFIFLDVREKEEWDTAKIPGATLVPLKTLPDYIKNLDKSSEIVVHCKSGGRSGRAVKMLIDQGFKAFNVVGGIDAWSQRIDPAVPRY